LSSDEDKIQSSNANKQSILDDPFAEIDWA